jgi:hypothetical protein
VVVVVLMVVVVVVTVVVIGVLSAGINSYFFMLTLGYGGTSLYVAVAPEISSCTPPNNLRIDVINTRVI